MEEGLPDVPALWLVCGSSWPGKKDQEAQPGEQVRTAGLNSGWGAEGAGPRGEPGRTWF